MNSIFTAALCCAAISYTITTTSIFEWFRNWFGKFHSKLDELIHCPWCLNHYVVLLYLILIINKPFEEILISISWYFAVIGLSGMVHYLLIRAYEPIARKELERKLKRKKDEQVLF